ncbi:MAG: peptide-methionine (S)-S-oxide reductase MsrA [Bacteroidales bacterium]|nr:peptide-methionine (S)-S-oxide reductase MsrA [Bacteroidales bacterium]
MSSESKIEQITLGGGCFWCVEAAFSMLEGVVETMPGYAGGKTENPTYKEVCTGNTAHAEVVQISFNPDKISLIEILNVFFTIHDPTSLNRQGLDIGTQYRSVIFYHNQNQYEIAKQIIEDLNNLDKFKEEIVTELFELPVFYPAEDYHKNYYENNPNEGYCQFTIYPKLAKLKTYFASKLK